MQSRRQENLLRILQLNYKPVASCRDDILCVQPAPPYNVFGVQGRVILCLSQLEFLGPYTGKKLLTKGEQAACRAMPGDPPEAHQHSIHWDVNEPDNSEGPIMAEIALLYVKWKMRLVVVREPNVRGTTKDRTRALMEVLKDLETRQIPARGFIEDLRRRFKFSAIKFSMDTAIKACMASGLSWLDGSKGPAASLGWERATWGPRLRVLPRPEEREGAGGGGGGGARSSFSMFFVL
jgi:hypothetical protein